LDGTGYPGGLKGEEIPVGARMISVADCFDAITTDRSYQKGRTMEEAFAILRKIGGKNLSPELVEAFIEDIKEKGML
ncbi:MAG: phosphohydrolase, partial [Proteobacteria bacterium]|nr:phosphohydrolase [Pseudomonadota bacterium]